MRLITVVFNLCVFSAAFIPIVALVVAVVIILRELL